MKVDITKQFSIVFLLAEILAVNSKPLIQFPGKK